MALLLSAQPLISLMVGSAARAAPLGGTTDLSPYEIDRVSTVNELSLYAIPAPRALKWDTPTDLVKSTLENYFHGDGNGTLSYEAIAEGASQPETFKASTKNHPISHLAVGLRCEGEKEIYTSMTGPSLLEVPVDLFVKGYGLGILFDPEAGTLTTGDSTWSDIAARQEKTGVIAELRFKLRPDQCVSLKQYLQQYIERGVDKVYGGLTAQPLRGEGAGCAAFGVSFLQVLGIIPNDPNQIPAENFAQAWRRTLSVSELFLGGQSHPARIGAYALIFGKKYDEWTPAGYPYVTASFWDPQNIYGWILAGSVEGQMVSNGVQLSPMAFELPASAPPIHTLYGDLSGQPTNLNFIWLPKGNIDQLSAVEDRAAHLGARN